MNVSHVVTDAINVQHTGSRSRRIQDLLRRRDSRTARADKNSSNPNRPQPQGFSAYFSWDDVGSNKYKA